MCTGYENVHESWILFVNVVCEWPPNGISWYEEITSLVVIDHAKLNFRDQKYICEYKWTRNISLEETFLGKILG